MDELLSVCIPTYNRAETLKGCLERLVPQAKAYNIPIYISDNASTDHTPQIVAQFQSVYPNIHYSRNVKNLGDVNLMFLMSMPGSRYVWLMGDRIRLINGAMDSMIKILTGNEYDLVVMNSYARFPAGMVKDLPNTKVYSDHSKLLSDLGWWMTFLGATVWNRDVAVNGEFAKYTGTEFVQIGVMFDYLAKKTPKVLWEPRCLIYAVGRSQWMKDVFDVSITKWMAIVRSLPNIYTDKAKDKCIKDLSVNNRYFSTLGFIMLRSLGIYDMKIYREFRDKFRYVSNVPDKILYMIALMPPWPLGVLDMARRIKNIINPRLK